MEHLRKNQSLQSRAKEMSIMPYQEIPYNINKTELANFEKWVSNKMQAENKFFLINYKGNSP